MKNKVRTMWITALMLVCVGGLFLACSAHNPEKSVRSAPPWGTNELPLTSAPPLDDSTVGPAKKPRLIRLFFATSRQQASQREETRADQHPKYFTRDRKTGPLTYGTCVVSMPLDRELPPGEVEGSKWLFIDLPDNPRDDVWMHRPKILGGKTEFLDALGAEIPKHAHRNVLIGVHGFNNSFEFAGRRLAKMVHDMNYQGIPVLYSWAAGDSVGDYGHDEEQVSYPLEIDRFVGFLEDVAISARAAGARGIHVVAHSMGNRLLQHAAIRLGQRASEQAALLDCVVLAAPDIPRDRFADEIWPSLVKITKRATLYLSAYDRALFGSERLHRTGPRLGQAGSIPLVTTGLDTVDASHADRTFLHHDHFLRMAGICDLAAFLIDELDASARMTSGFLRKPSLPPEAGWFELIALSSSCR